MRSERVGGFPVMDGTMTTPMLMDTPFVELMARRVCNVLIVANPYDAFMLEDDGRIDEKMFREYASLGLRFPPRFSRVTDLAEAERYMERDMPDMVICMPAADGGDAFAVAREIRATRPALPVVVLTPFSHGAGSLGEPCDMGGTARVFCWLGNTDLLISIIKLMEDKMNLEHDVRNGGVSVIMLVEDNVRYYSSMLPLLYKFVLQQSLEFATEALNSRLETLRMRGRPKIVLARNYEEAWGIYTGYARNVLGVISDCEFAHNGVMDSNAGAKLLSAIHKMDPYMPLVMASNRKNASGIAWRSGATFIDKTSKRLDTELRQVLMERFGFGDFVFRDQATGEEVCRCRNLMDLQNNIMTVPAQSLIHHITHNNVSRWLCSRALYSISEYLRSITWKGLPDIDAHRRIIFNAIVAYRRMKNSGVVAVFQPGRYDRYSNFARIGDGSLGGKGRGLAFLDNIMNRRPSLHEFQGVEVGIPRTVVLCTDVFDEFMETNRLYPVALSDRADEEILRHFLQGRMPARLLGDLTAFLSVVDTPIAVRSSSLLEDSHYQPFAGVYSTYMVPYTNDKYQRLETLASAVKAVFASVFYRASKDYMAATSNVIDNEKMAVILQEVAGLPHGTRFYPHISGVARSLNYYPLGDEKPEEGTVSLALGLGKHIVDGGTSLRFSPAHPEQVLQTSETEIALRDTQTSFLALNLADTKPDFTTNDGFNLLRLPVREAEEDGTLQWITSTYDPQDMRIYDSYYPGRNRKILSFAGVLRHGVIPLPEILREMLRLGQEEMRRPVEIEFAVNLRERGSAHFYPLQIRPMADRRSQVDEDLSAVPEERCLMASPMAIGHGTVEGIYDVVYIPAAAYNPADNQRIASVVERVNRGLLGEGRRYILIGPGRWGSSDPWLGVPVKWPHISGACMIAELTVDAYNVDPSQGTHFFQNITSLGVSYLTINQRGGQGFFREDELAALPNLCDTPSVRHVRLPSPLTAKTDGLNRLAVVMK